MESALRGLIPWLSTGISPNPLDFLNPVRPIMQWYYSGQLNRFLSSKLDQRLDSLQSSDAKPGKSVVDLALKTYFSDDSTNKPVLPSSLKTFILDQIKLFIFAGHDTTSSTICYSYHLLSKSPKSLSALRAEHDEVLGTDITKAASLIQEKPHLLNSLPYTLAVIKETLRLFPTSASLRTGSPNVSLTDEQGQKYPTKHCMIFSNHQGLGRNAEFWPKPDEFIPERFLVGQGDPLYPVKGAWRPFELGPRNCVGQELANLEMKAVLALTAREFEIEAAYDEIDRKTNKTGLKTVNGERAYQIIYGAAHPVGGLPCRVKLATS